MAKFNRVARASVKASDSQVADMHSRDKRRRDRAFGALMSSFRFAVDKAGILSDLSQTIAYVKPSDKRRAAKRSRELELRRGGNRD